MRRVKRRVVVEDWERVIRIFFCAARAGGFLLLARMRDDPFLTRNNYQGDVSPQRTTHSIDLSVYRTRKRRIA